MGGHTRIAQGTYPRSVLRHLFLLGPVTLGPGQYSLLWHAWKLAGYYLMSVLYPPIQEEVTIRKNIARGPNNTDKATMTMMTMTMVAMMAKMAIVVMMTLL